MPRGFKMAFARESGRTLFLTVSVKLVTDVIEVLL